jgi:hypothetical protein
VPRRNGRARPSASSAEARFTDLSYDPAGSHPGAAQLRDRQRRIAPTLRAHQTPDKGLQLLPAAVPVLAATTPATGSLLIREGRPPCQNHV